MFEKEQNLEAVKRKTIRAPFFELGPKAYMYGSKMLEVALAADRISEDYDVDIILTPQYVDIQAIAEKTSKLHVFAQHMDYIPVGRGIGTVLPEAVVEVGGEGVLLNHCERRLSIYELEQCVERAQKLGLATMICADNETQAAMISHLKPTIIIAESPELVGGGKRSVDESKVVASINNTVGKISSSTLVLQGAGINDERDVYNLIKAGAHAAGSSSAVFKAEDPVKMLEKMIASLRKAWDEVHTSV